MVNLQMAATEEDAADLLTRPEVRGRYFEQAPSASKVTLLETLAPGDAPLGEIHELQSTNQRFFAMKFTEVS